jgi:xanthine dehydrogenase molybdenum-binding subunit
VERQLEGGIMQGIGYALIGNFTVNRVTGALETNNFSNYRIPSIMDRPEIEIILVEHPTPSGPFGAKSVGESGIMSIAPAVINAVYNAVGIRIKKLPITPEQVLDELMGIDDEAGLKRNG